MRAAGKLFFAITLLALLSATFLSTSAVQPETAGEEAEYRLCWSGDLQPGQILTVSIQPELPGAMFALRLDDGLWTVLEGNQWQIPFDLSGQHLLQIRGFSGDGAQEVQLELPLDFEPLPEDMTPQEATLPTEDIPLETTIPPETAPPVEEVTPSVPEPLFPGLYFGQLHAHSDLSSGTQAPEVLYRTAREAELDFFALTDHSHSFGNSDTAALWAAGRETAEDASCEEFSALWGYEMSWPAQLQIGHIGVFAASKVESWEQPAYENPYFALSHFYDALSAISGAIGQFCHPGTQYGSFDNFRLPSREADKVMALLEIPCLTAQADCDSFYIAALDAGWHVAPTGSQPWPGNAPGWTVASAQSLTEDDILDALRSRRVYATGDPDLHITYTLNSAPMGSILERRNVGDIAVIAVSLWDPTDSAVGLVEVITTGGCVLASQALEESCGELAFSLPAEHPYYYLRITQPDGQTALTAPVWVDQQEDVGISHMRLHPEVIEAGTPFTLNLELYNQEQADFLVTSVKLYAGEQLLLEESQPMQISAGTQYTHGLTAVCDAPGITTLTAEVSGTLEDSPRTYRHSLSVTVHHSRLVTDILVDGSHGNPAVDALTHLTAAAAEDAVRVSILREEISPENLNNCRLLLIFAPTEPFSDDFLSAVSEFTACGGSILVCGPENAAENPHELNRLLESIGSSLRLLEPGAARAVPSARFNREAPLCLQISPGMTYGSSGSCTVDPGSGTWLVARSEDDSVVLAQETLSSGASVFAAGSCFLRDAYTAQPEGMWALPYANRILMLSLLGSREPVLPLSSISQARQGEDGDLFRIRGYVTAGTANPHNSFPDTLYLQDDTGGIAVIPVTRKDISVGTPVEVIGSLSWQGKNITLVPDSLEILAYDFHRYTGLEGNWASLLDLNRHGGSLIRIEGTCTEALCDGNGILRQFSLKDGYGNTAEVLIEESIGATATGENTLSDRILPGRTVRAAGILHADENGNAVVRVKNCEEVVYVPPRSSDNPKTGDPLGFFLRTRKITP